MKHCNWKMIYLLNYHVNTSQFIRWYQIKKCWLYKFFVPKASLDTHTIMASHFIWELPWSLKSFYTQGTGLFDTIKHVYAKELKFQFPTRLGSKLYSNIFESYQTFLYFSWIFLMGLFESTCISTRKMFLTS